MIQFAPHQYIVCHHFFSLTKYVTTKLEKVGITMDQICRNKKKFTIKKEVCDRCDNSIIINTLRA